MIYKFTFSNTAGGMVSILIDGNISPENTKNRSMKIRKYM